MKRNYQFWTYIVTNYERTALYTGVTNNLAQRLKEHYDNRGEDKTFAGRYYCYNLVYYEFTQYVNNAILREKEIKNMSRANKMAMITTFNPNWTVLNVSICGEWPPTFEGRSLLHDKLNDNERFFLNSEKENIDEWWVGLTPPPLTE
jgi:putative endonuclease